MSVKDCLIRPDKGVSSKELPEPSMDGEGVVGGDLVLVLALDLGAGLGFGMDWESRLLDREGRLLDWEGRLLDLVVLLDLMLAISPVAEVTFGRRAGAGVLRSVS